MLIAISSLRIPRDVTVTEGEALGAAKGLAAAACDKGPKVPPLEAVEDLEGRFLVTSGSPVLHVASAWGIARLFVVVTGDPSGPARAQLDLEAGSAHPSAEAEADKELAGIMIHFRDVATGVEVRDRKYRLKKYKQCFVGSHAVSFLVDNGYTASRNQAVALGERMRQKGLFAHVVDDHPFSDQKLFFRFNPDYIIETSSYSILDTQSAAASAAAKLSTTKYASLSGVAEWDELSEAANQQLLDLGIELRRLDDEGESSPHERLAITSTLAKVHQVISKLAESQQGQGIADHEAKRRGAALDRLAARYKEAQQSFAAVSSAHRASRTDDFSSYDWAADIAASDDMTDATNEELLMLQRQIMSAQDDGLRELSDTLDRQIRIGRLIGDELDKQNEVLANLVQHVDETQERINDASEGVNALL